jgi:Calcineurin-like phosphoesterase.
MKFVVFSDIHGGIGYLHDDDYSDTILIIAGDYDETKRSRYRTGIEALCKQFKNVVLVPGNHEYYGSNIHKTHKVLQQMDDEISNFIFMQDNYCWIDDVLIVGSTLWTDFNKGDPLVKFDARMKMNDYKHIRHGPVNEPWKTKLTVEDVEFMHHKSKKYIKMIVDTERDLVHNDIKIVVVTHHAPSYQSVSTKYKNDSLNGCYCSDMDQYIEELGVDVWIHGHVHSSFDYNIGKTRIICNPRGYESFSGASENFDYSPKFIFEV